MRSRFESGRTGHPGRRVRHRPGGGPRALAALRRDSAFDDSLSVTSLALTALPEFVIGIALVLVFATNVLHILPAISLVLPGTNPL